MTSLGALREQHELDDAQVAALEGYLDLLLGWRRGNVTAVRTRDAAVDTLIGDSLALLDVPAVSAAGLRWLDLGSGAGVPGIPLTVARPEALLTLLDSVARKCAFLEAAVETTGLSGRARVVCARSEDFARPPIEAGGPVAAGRTVATGPGRDAFDVVFARAVASLATVAELAAPLLARGGVLLAVKSSRAARDERGGGETAARRCGLAAGPVVPLVRSPLPDSVCAVFEKHGETPDWLPRRSGLAGKRPLTS